MRLCMSEIALRSNQIISMTAPISAPNADEDLDRDDQDDDAGHVAVDEERIDARRASSLRLQLRSG